MIWNTGYSGYGLEQEIAASEHIYIYINNVSPYIAPLPWVLFFIGSHMI